MQINLTSIVSTPIRLSLSIILILNLYVTKAAAQHIDIIQQGTSTSIRGLSVVNNNVAWLSGSKGTVAITIDGGKTWRWQKVKDFEHADFRAIEAFSDKEAIIMSSGTPALILKTLDGGNTWTTKYHNADTLYFLDAMDFIDNKHGFVLGDPVNNKFILLETTNGGETWTPFKNQPGAMPGEACFAASGTCLRVKTDGIYVVTGGTKSRMLYYNFKNKKWKNEALPLTHGKASQGAFSLAINNTRQIFVGGDYVNNKKIDSVAALLSDGTIKLITHGPAGYQSCVEYISGNTFLSTGTSGTNISTDNGRSWAKIDTSSFNVCRKAKRGTLVLLAGDNGKIAILNP